MKKLPLFTSLFIVSLLVGLASCTKEEFFKLIDKAEDKHSEKELAFVFTLSNATSGNSVMAYTRSQDGILNQVASPYPTGGMGSGAGLGSQGALVLQPESKLLFAVNAGSNEVSVLKVKSGTLQLLDVVSSGGVMPISLTVYKNLLYVLNAGANGNITGFRIDNNGKLSPISGATQLLSGSQAGPAQVQFSPDGKLLVVTEKMTNKITAYVVGSNGVAGAPLVQNSSGATPFGFYFSKNNQLVVSEAFGGATDQSKVSSYTISDDGSVHVITASIPTKQTAACWVIVTSNAQYAYATNTGSGSITGFKIASDGSLSRLNEDGRTGITGEGSKPIDMALSKNSHHLYDLNSGTQSISVFSVNSNDGSLKWLQEIKGLPTGAVGLAAM